MEESVAGNFLFAANGWQLEIRGDDPETEGWAATLLALSNGALGVRGVLEEGASISSFMAHAYEQAPIHFHERLHGFPQRGDLRVPVIETLGLKICVDGKQVDFAGATSVTNRTLDLRTGVLRRSTRWVLADGYEFTVEAERLIPLDGRTVMMRRLRVGGAGTITLHPFLSPAPRQAGQSDDPRIGVTLTTGGFKTEMATSDQIVERLQGSGIAVAAAQRDRNEAEWLEIATGLAVGREASDTLLAHAKSLANNAILSGFDDMAAHQFALLKDFWNCADILVEGDDRLTAALRLNLFHLFASAGKDGLSSAAAKGLTGEGYEGHYFWDAEVFMLPALILLTPNVAKAMLEYRANTLDAAIANARALDHQRGALFAWRTIAGRECSAHYPSGSAQYHINAAVAFAIGLYVDATGDEQFMIDHGAKVLVETARLWLELGDWQEGAFHLHGVTGPDEYTALVDDNWYTNRMAQKHLRQAVAAVHLLTSHHPEIIQQLNIRDGELQAFSEAADAMFLPFDTAKDLDAQDRSFLGKPVWDMAATPKEKFPLLLHFHPMTLYRHQVAKQADLILGLILGGEEVSLERKQRAFEYYEPLTTHDLTLSASSFAILAAEIGDEEAALRFMADTSFVDLDDQHGNTDHGVHMAALGGSWMTLVWGMAGFRPNGGLLSLKPICPKLWEGYQFGLNWRGTELHVKVTHDEVAYHSVNGPDLTLMHHGQLVVVPAGGEWVGPLLP